MKKPKHRRSLRAFREHYGLSQQFAADQIGINDVTVYRIETGISQPRGLTRRAIEKWMDDYEATAAGVAQSRKEAPEHSLQRA